MGRWVACWHLGCLLGDSRNICPIRPLPFALRSLSGIVMESPKKKGRREIWTPRDEVTVEDLAAADVAIERWTKPDQTERVLGAFDALKAKYGYEKALKGIFGQFISSGLAPGSIETYMTYIVDARRPSTNQEWLVKARVMEAAQRMHADADTRQAPDVSTENLVRLLELDRVTSFDWIVTYLCIVTGNRPSDLVELRVKQFVLAEDPASFAIQYRLTKAQKKRGKRRQLQFPFHFMPEIAAFYNRFRDFFGRYVSEHDHKWKPFEELSTSAYLQRLQTNYKNLFPTKKKKPDKDDEASPHITTYSFRVRYLNLVFDRCNGDFNIYKKYTLHIDDKMVQAHYRRFPAQAQAVVSSSGSEGDDDSD